MHIITNFSSRFRSSLAILAACSFAVWGVGCPRVGGTDVAGSAVMRTVEISDAFPDCVTLYAGQTIDVGTVCVSVDELADTSAQCGAGAIGALIVTYTTTGGWELSEAHLAVGDELDDFPINNGGNPMVGQFPYSASGLSPLTSYAFEVPLCELGLDGSDTTCEPLDVYLAAHAVVYQAHGGGGQETAWGDGDRFTEQGNWATYFNETLTCNPNGGTTSGGETTSGETTQGGDTKGAETTSGGSYGATTCDYADTAGDAYDGGTAEKAD